ncbi:hypothetical protein [Streptomyces qinzhouensis]|uniref:hypothetical protein n=1 Tax=Streptomyces qinzhouensis TaxID=2599401 RepID=UPI001646D73B|nr:hypothetical protein [Streptomyces qinzhouensis]
MTRDGLLKKAPEPAAARCAGCGRITTAPVGVQPGRMACPEHIVEALTSGGG